MKKMGKLLAVLLSLAMLISIGAACSKTGTTTSPSASVSSAAPSSAAPSSAAPSATASASASATPSATPSGPPVSAKDTVNVAITQDRGTLDPLYTVGWDNQQCLRLVYEPLWEYDELYNNIKFVLATSIDDSNPLKWIVKLRHDVKFANGNPFTAEDVVYSLWLANNRKGEPAYFLYMDNTATGTKALDDYTVEIDFTQYNNAYAKSFATIFMYDKESYNPDKVAFETNGTGPYKVTDYVIQSHLDLTLRDGYWGTEPPVKNVSFKVLAEAEQRVNALQAGEVDVCPVPFQDVEFVKTLDTLTVREAPARSDRAIILNVTNKDSIFYNNMDARLAVFRCIDPASVLKIVYNGYGTVAKGTYSINSVDVNLDDFGKGIYDGQTYNVAEAKKLAESSGLTKVTLTCINNGTADMVTTSELLQQALKEIGVTCKVQTTDAGSWLTYRFDDKKFDLCIDFTSGLTATANLPVWWQYCGNAPSSGDPVGSETLRKITDELAGVSDPAVQKKDCSIMNDELLKLNYFYNLVDMTTFQGINKNLELPRISNSWIDWSGAYWTK